MGGNSNIKKKIVAVNDTSFQLTLLRSILEKEGYEVDCYESAEDALLSLTAENIPDLIITDLHMPGIDGWRFCRLLRSPEYSHLNHVPILANSSTFGGADTLSISSAAGADAFLESPYKKDDLLRFVRDLIDGKRPGKQPSLLIVEDSEQLAQSLKQVMEQAGFDVSIASDGASARKIFNQHDPETVIMDHHLPDLSGLRLLEDLEAKNHKTAFIFITSDEDQELAVQAIKMGASAFVRKPCSNDYLVELVRKAHREKSLMAVENLLEIRTQKLMEEERKHKAVMDSAHEGFCISIDGNIQYCNPAFAYMLGKSVESVINTNLLECVDEVDRERIESIYQRYARGERDLGLLLFSLNRSDGKRCIVEVSGSWIEYEGKAAVLCVLRDVTETKYLEKEVYEQRQRYADMLSNMQISITLVDRDMRILWVNDFTKKEFPDNNPVGCFCYEYFENRESPIENCPVMKCFETGGVYRRESHNPKNDKWYFSTSYPIKDEDGQVFQVMKISIDITDRKKHEERLALQALVLNQIRDCVTITDLDGRITYVNDAEVIALGYPREELIGQPVEMYGDDPEKGATQQDIVKTTLQKGVWRGEVVNTTADGSEIVMDCRTQVVVNESGEEIALCGIATDVTERKLHEESLRLQRDLSAILAKSTDLDEILRESLKTSIKISELDCGGIYLTDEQDGSLTLANHRGIPSSWLKKVSYYKADSPEAILVRKQEARYASFNELSREIGADISKVDIRALAVVPIVHEGKSVGSLNIGSFTRDDIPLRAQTLLETIAGQIGTMILRYRIFSELQIQRENLSTFFNTINDFLFVMDEDGTILQVNNTVIDRLGYRPEEVVNKSILEFYPADLKEEAGRVTEKILEGDLETNNIPLLSKDGELIPVETKMIKGRWNCKPAVFGISRDISKRLWMENELRESERQKSAMIEAIPDFLFRIDKDNRFTFVHANNAEALLVSPEKAIGKLCEEILPPHLANQTKEIAALVLKTGRIEEYDYSIEIEGIKQYFEARMVKCSTDEVLVLVRDITERKLAEDAIRKSEEKYSTIVKMAPEAILTCDMQGLITFANDQASILFNLPEEEIVIGRNISDFLPEEEVQKVIANKQLTLSGKDPGADEYRIIRADGNTIDAEVHGEILWDDYGQPSGWILLVRDITEQKRFNEMLEAREERFRKLIHNSNDILVILDENGTEQYVSDSIERVTGLTVEECIGVSGFEFVHPDDLEKTKNAFKKVLEFPEKPITVLYRQTTKSGDWIYFETIATNWLHEPSINGIVLNIRDVTDRKHAEEEKDKLEQQLTQALKMEAIGRLAGGVAHDFNNILTGISGSAAMAMMDYESDPSLMATFKEISDASDRAAGLTRQLLAFSRKQILEPKVISLNHLIENLMKMLVRLIGEDISFTFSPKRRLGRILADPGQIEQVIINLCVNARDAMPNGGKLTIETSNVELDEAYCEDHQYVTPGRYVQIIVSDTGTGMDEETKKRIFEPFFTTKPTGQGTGLGLATIYGIIKQHEGHVEVYSEAGMGTTFRVYLPCNVEAFEEPSKKDNVPSMKTGSETIMLVEDENLVRLVGVKILKRLGYTVLEAVSGEDARKISDEYKFDIDLLMTDVVMPGENGRELAEYIQKTRSGIKVLFTSGYTEDAIAHHGVLDEGLNFIGKPYSPADLAKKIRELLDE